MQFGNVEAPSPSGPSGLLQAALGCVDLTSSMTQTLQSIDANVSVDKRILLPNGGQFVKTKSNSISDRATRDNITHKKVTNFQSFCHENGFKLHFVTISLLFAGDKEGSIACNTNEISCPC